jgi:hypothetical protein
MSEEEIKAGSVNGKPIWISRTMIAAGVTALAPYLPYVRDWVAADPGVSLTIAGVLFGILRIVTTGRVEWSKKI